MPREYVHGDLILGEDGQEPETESLVSIGWERGGWVQVGSMARARVTHETVNEGWFVDLDRYACNDLIRKLRRARDQAFGRDE